MANDPSMEDEVFVERINLALWRKLLKFARPYRRHIALLMSIACVVATFDVTLPRFTGKFVDAITAGDVATFHRLLWPYISVCATFILCIFTFILTAGRIATGIGFDIRQAAFEKLQELPFSFYDRKAVGWLMARLTGDCSNLSRIMGWALLDLTWCPCVLTLITGMMFYLNWKLALLVVAVTPILLYISLFFQVRLLLTSRALRKANSQTTAAFNEGIVGVRTSKSLVREEHNLEEFTNLTQTMYNHALKNALYSATFIPLMLTLCSIGMALGLWRGGFYVTSNQMSLGFLVAFLQYAWFVQWPVQEGCNMLTQVLGAQASAERIQGLLDADVEIRDSDEVIQQMALRARSTSNSSPRYSGERLGEGRSGELSSASPRPENVDKTLAPDGYPAQIQTIEFRDVSFAYKQGQSVLEHFNLIVRSGQTIALVGPTGGGKTTIVGLACRFYEPTSGQVLINSLDYRQRSLKWLQSNLGMVLQQPHLFSGTVRENIRYGRLNATDAEIEQAAKLVNAHDFILTLKDSYNTNVGEGGNQLSTGQKQLISLARAIIASPQIFVMDEATSSVDTQTERAIQSAIERVLESRISFVIAHRLSTIKNADRILLIEKGRMIEDGTHHQLIQKRGRYFELYTNQFTHEREEKVLEEVAPVK